MTTLKEAAQQALAYMESVGPQDMYPEEWAIAEALRATLALVAADERARIIAMLREMHEEVRHSHNYYAYAANLIEAME